MTAQKQDPLGVMHAKEKSAKYAQGDMGGDFRMTGVILEERTK